MTKAQIEWTQRLYRQMPGARMPVTEDGVFMWGEVDGTPEWDFCAEIVLSVTEYIKTQDVYRGV